MPAIDIIKKTPRLRNPDTIFIPANLRLDDKGPKVTPWREPYKSRLIDWFVFDDGRGSFPENTVLTPDTHRLYSRSGSGRYLTPSSTNVTYKVKFAKTSFFRHAYTYNDEAVSSPTCAWDLKPNYYRLTNSDSFTLVVVFGVFSTSGNVVFRVKSAWGANSSNNLELYQSTGSGGLFYYTAPGTFQTSMTGSYTTTDIQNYYALPTSVFADSGVIHVSMIHYSPTTQLFYPEAFHAIHDDGIHGRSSMFLPKWTSSSSYFDIYGFYSYLGVASSKPCLYEIILFSPSIGPVRQSSFNAGNQSLSDRFFRGYLIPRYGLDKLYIFRDYTVHYQWPLHRRLPGDSLALPRATPGMPFRYTRSRLDRYGLRRLGKRMMFNDGVVYCGFAPVICNDESASSGTGLNNYISQIHTFKPISFESR